MEQQNAAVAEALLNHEGRDKRREEFERDYFPDDITNDKNRTKTDPFWIWPLIVCFILYWVAAGLALKDLSFDSVANTTAGVTCGVDSNVLDKPYLLHVDSRNCYYKSKDGPKDPIRDFNYFCSENSICVKECPKTSFDLDDCGVNTFESFKQNIICHNRNALINARNCGDLRLLHSKGVCTNWYTESTPDGKICKPSKVEESLKKYVSDKYNRVNRTYSSNNTTYNDVEFDPTYDVDISANILKPIFAALFVTLAFTFLLVRTMKWLAAYIFYGFFIAIFSLFVIFLIFVIVSAHKTEDPVERAHNTQVAYIVAGVFATVLLIFAAVLYCFRTKIRYGIEMVKEGSRAVTCSTPSVFLPIIPFIIRAFFLIITVFFVFAVATNHSYDYVVKGLNSESYESCVCSLNNGDTCTPQQFNNVCKAGSGICVEASCSAESVTWPFTAYIYWTILIFTGMWCVAFVCALTKMILAHAFGQWYWKFNKEMIPSGTISEGITRMFNYHLGTAAFASLVITLCRILRFLMNSNDKSSSNKKGVLAIIGEVIVLCLKWFADALLRLIQYISDQALVICSIHGIEFWNSVKRVSKLFLKDILLVAAVENVSDIVLGVSKFIVALTSAGVAYAFTDKDEFGGFWFLFILLVFFFAYDLSSILFTSYHIAIDTILVCTLEEWTYTKAQKRYFHSEILNKLLADQPETPAAAV